MGLDAEGKALLAKWPAVFQDRADGLPWVSACSVHYPSMRRAAPYLLWAGACAGRTEPDGLWVSYGADSDTKRFGVDVPAEWVDVIVVEVLSKAAS